MKKTILALVSLLITISMLTTVKALAATRYVAKTGGNIGNCTASPCLTITYAIGQASGGDTINVAAGTYAENVSVGKSLSIIGADKTTTIIDAGNSGIVVLITTSNVTLKNFTIRNSGADIAAHAGVLVVSATGAVTGCNIENNIITGNANAIGLMGVSSNTVKYNTIKNSARYGIVLSTSPYTGLFSTLNTILGNTLTNNARDGIYVDQNSHNNTILNNSVSAATGTTEPSGFEGNGVYFWKSSGHTVTGNTIFGNATYGIELMGSSDNTITNNVIYGNTLHGLAIRCGVLSSTNNDITDNIIKNNSGAGILLRDDASTNNYEGVVSGNTISKDSIHGNASGGILTEDSPAGVLYDAAGNWWGCAAGPGEAGCDTASANVTCDPWLLAPYPVSIALEPASDTIYVGANRQYAATGTLLDGTTADVILECVFTSESPTIVTIDSLTGLATGMAPGSATIAGDCFDGAFVPSATLNVEAATGKPIANAGSYIDGVIGRSFELNGSASSDPLSLPLTYSWTEFSSNPVLGLISDPTQEVVTITPTVEGIYEFSLVVSNGSLTSDPATVKAFIGREAFEEEVAAATGGAVVVDDPASALYGARIDIPAGALSDDTVISIGEIDDPPPMTGVIGRVAGVAVVLGPSGIQFSKPVTIYVPFDDTEARGFGANIDKYVIFSYNLETQQWEEIEATKIDGPPAFLTAQVTHFSIYQAGYTTKSTTLMMSGGACTLVDDGSKSNCLNLMMPLLIMAMLFGLRKLSLRKN